VKGGGRRLAFGLLLFGGVFLAAMILCPLVGTVPVDLSRAFDFSIPIEENRDREIFFRLRLPRVLLAALVGGSLAVAGAAFQALLRNALAEPYTLGVAGGASLGAVLAIHGGLAATFLGIPAVPIAAFLGAVLSVALVFFLARSGRRLPTVTLLLAGVTVNVFFSAMILIINYLADLSQIHRMIHWMMGGIDTVGIDKVVRTLPFAAVGIAILWSQARAFNVLSLGEETARSLGVDVERTKLVAFGAASLVTGAAISASGPIGFVGLIVPHSVRLVLGPDHRLLIPASVLAGGAFLAVCDTVARTALPSGELPVGVLTGLLGGPFFVWLLKTRTREISS
jgi:iron complex transport system permease protein